MNKNELEVVKGVVDQIDKLMVADTEVVLKSSGKVALAALERRDLCQGIRTKLNGLVSE